MFKNKMIRVLNKSEKKTKGELVHPPNDSYKPYEGK